MRFWKSLLWGEAQGFMGWVTLKQTTQKKKKKKQNAEAPSWWGSLGRLFDTVPRLSPPYSRRQITERVAASEVHNVKASLAQESRADKVRTIW